MPNNELLFCLKTEYIMHYMDHSHMFNKHNVLYYILYGYLKISSIILKRNSAMFDIITATTI